jgi:hypothetical protein
MTHAIEWYILRAVAFVAWNLSAISLALGIGFLVDGGVGHSLSGGAALVIMAMPAALLLMVGMLCFRATQSKSLGKSEADASDA